MNYRIKIGVSVVIFFAVILSSYSSSDFTFFLSGKGNSLNKFVNDPLITNTNSLNIGYFPNLNHAQAILGFEKGDFTEKFNREFNSSNFTVGADVFGSETLLLEALYGEIIDVAYVNPNTIIDGFMLLGDQDFKIISGVSSGGTSFVVRNDSGIESVKDLGGKKFAVTQLGNTQYVALTKYLINNGFNTIEKGGDITIVALKPSDIISQFKDKEIDGAWVPEPIPTILKQVSNGKILVYEKDLWPDGKFVTANIIVRADYLRHNPEIIKKLLEAHVEETLWINEKLTPTNNTEIDKNKLSVLVSSFNNSLKNITGKTYPEIQLGEGLSKIEFTTDPLVNSLHKIINQSSELDIIELGTGWREAFSKIYDLTLLNEVLSQKGLGNISVYD